MSRRARVELSDVAGLLVVASGALAALWLAAGGWALLLAAAMFDSPSEPPWNRPPLAVAILSLPVILPLAGWAALRAKRYGWTIGLCALALAFSLVVLASTLRMVGG